MILETQGEQVRYVTNYFQNRFDYLISDGRNKDAAAVYNELVLEDDSHSKSENWIFIAIEVI
jgi:hypothetical protein